MQPSAYFYPGNITIIKTTAAAVEIAWAVAFKV